MPLKNPKLTPDVPSPAAVRINRHSIGSGFALIILATVVFITRIWTRTHTSNRLGWEDYSICMGYVCLITGGFLWIGASFVIVLSPKNNTVADTELSFLLNYVGRWFWPWSMSFVKLSVVIMLLRFHTKKFWRYFLFAVIGLQFGVTVYTMVFYSVECNHVRGSCVSHDFLRRSVAVVASINVFTDVVLSLAPIPLLRRIRRPLCERIAVAVLMAMGLTASAAALTKAVLALSAPRNDDILAQSTVRMCALVEQELAFIAACIPCLKSLLHRFLIRIGLAPTARAFSCPTWEGDSSFSAPSGTSGTSNLSDIEAEVHEDADHNGNLEVLPSGQIVLASPKKTKSKSKGSSGKRSPFANEINWTSKDSDGMRIEDTNWPIRASSSRNPKEIKNHSYSASEEEIIGLAELRRDGEIWRTSKIKMHEERTYPGSPSRQG